MIQGQGVLLHGLEHKLAVGPQSLGGKLQGIAFVPHCLEHDLAIGLQLPGGRRQGPARLPHCHEYDLAVRPELLSDKLQVLTILPHSLEGRLRFARNSVAASSRLAPSMATEALVCLLMVFGRLPIVTRIVGLPMMLYEWSVRLPSKTVSSFFLSMYVKTRMSSSPSLFHCARSSSGISMACRIS
eukprot:SRR837773.17933.p2 GENE.SRR837773.17933~~SRR837773.17933.p2  ORF type:complete len:185 (+),score=28.42 SRR837773.17933:1-555(+)